VLSKICKLFNELLIIFSNTTLHIFFLTAPILYFPYLAFFNRTLPFALIFKRLQLL
jgi:hypothetical protein